MSARAELCVVGSANLDLVATTARLPGPGETVLGDSFAEYPGGKGLNQAVAAARTGTSTSLCACVGDDDAGRALRAVAQEAGIRDDHVSVAEGVPTGRALIAVAREESQNLIVVAPGANLALSADAATEAVRGARVVLAQLEVPVAVVIAAFRAARRSGAMTILNPAPAEAATDELLSLCDLVVPNQHEAALLGGADAILGAGAGQVIVTLGARGSVLTGLGGDEQAVAPFAVAVADTTGAGDAYCGALAAALAGGAEIREALRFASASGALATTKPGAVPSLPDRDAIEELLLAAAQ
ncbi:MAG: ribokinase [Solirubrobacteraceae bacterium]